MICSVVMQYFSESGKVTILYQQESKTKQYVTCVTYVDSSLLFITRQNPDLYIRISKRRNALWDTLNTQK